MNCNIEKIMTSGIVTNIENSKIYIDSKDTPSLESITVICYGGIELNGEKITPENNPNFGLKIGSKVEFYYYQRYVDYIQKNISVDYRNIIQ